MLHTAHSLTLFCQSSELWRNPTIADLSTLENTSICCAAVDMLVISPWKPASDINCNKYKHKLMRYHIIFLLQNKIDFEKWGKSSIGINKEYVL